MLALNSTAFHNSGPIPKKYTGDSSDISPPLQWDGEPQQTKSFALICDDPDAPKNWVHWVMFNIPSSTHTLPERVPPANILQDGSIQGTNDFKSIGYQGPLPPQGTHRYFFKLYALDTELTLPPGASKRDLLHAIEGHILERAQIMGTYARK